MKRLACTLLALGGLGLAGCEDKPTPSAAPTTSALAPAKPTTEAAKAFAVETDGSKVRFEMEAPIEKIFGEADGSAKGDVFIDEGDLGRSSGLLEIDLDKLVIYQQKREKEDAAFGERSKSDLQNEHARNWLGIGKDVSDAERQKHRVIAFKITKVEPKGAKSLAELQGGERKATLVVTGDLRLNERTVQKTAELEVTFTMNGDKPSAVHVKTTKPIAVNLDEHDVRPKDTLGKLLQKTTEELTTLGKKVSKDAMVSIDITAKPR